jgi:hypothetical protein
MIPCFSRIILSIGCSPRVSVRRIYEAREPCSTRWAEALLYQEHALAGRLGVEQAASLAVGEKPLDIDFALDDKARAVGLAVP